MNAQTPRVQILQAEVVDTRMVMTLRLEDGRSVSLSGALPKGSMVDIYCTDIARNGAIIGYDGYEVAARATRNRKAVLSAKADALFIPLAEEVRV